MHIGSSASKWVWRGDEPSAAGQDGHPIGISWGGVGWVRTTASVTGSGTGAPLACRAPRARATGLGTAGGSVSGKPSPGPRRPPAGRAPARLHRPCGLPRWAARRWSARSCSGTGPARSGRTGRASRRAPGLMTALGHRHDLDGCDFRRPRRARCEGTAAAAAVGRGPAVGSVTFAPVDPLGVGTGTSHARGLAAVEGDPDRSGRRGEAGWVSNAG